MFVKSTVALATTAPLASPTVPVTVALSCAHAHGVRTTIIMVSAIQSTPIPFFDLSVKRPLDWVKACVIGLSPLKLVAWVALSHLPQLLVAISRTASFANQKQTTIQSFNR